jgi:hypothetical protein
LYRLKSLKGFPFWSVTERKMVIVVDFVFDSMMRGMETSIAFVESSFMFE